MIRGQVVVIRVYRWRRKGGIVGVLESANNSKQTPFRSFGELRRVMSAVLVEDPPGKSVRGKS